MPIAVNRPAHRGQPQPDILYDGQGRPIHDRTIARDGESVRRSFPLMDTARPDTAARDALVRAKLGAAADGKCDAFMDAAYRTLTGAAPTAAAPVARIGLTDAQRAVSQRGIDAALAHNTKRQAPVTDAGRDPYVAMCNAISGPSGGSGKRPFIDAAPRRMVTTDTARSDARRGAYDAYAAGLQDAWKGAA